MHDPEHGIKQISRWILGIAISAIGGFGFSVEVAFTCKLDQALVQDQPCNDTYGESATAEAESKDLVARLIIAAKKLVEVKDIALEAIAECAAKNR
jgi:hypothetical protein